MSTYFIKILLAVRSSKMAVALHGTAYSWLYIQYQFSGLMGSHIRTNGKPDPTLIIWGCEVVINGVPGGGFKPLTSASFVYCTWLIKMCLVRRNHIIFRVKVPKLVWTQCCKHLKIRQDALSVLEQTQSFRGKSLCKTICTLVASVYTATTNFLAELRGDYWTKPVSATKFC